MTIIYAALTFQFEDVPSVRYVLISDTDTCYIQSLPILKLLLVSTCQCRVQCFCLVLLFSMYVLVFHKQRSQF